MLPHRLSAVPQDGGDGPVELPQPRGGVLVQAPGRQQGHHQGDQTPDDGILASRERPAFRGGQQDDQDRLQAHLQGERRARVQESGHHDGGEHHDHRLPQALPQHGLQEVADQDAQGAAHGHFEHLADLGVAIEAQGDQCRCGREQRFVMPQHVLGEGVGAHGADGGDQGRHHGRAHSAGAGSHPAAQELTGADAAGQLFALLACAALVHGTSVGSGVDAGEGCLVQRAGHHKQTVSQFTRRSPAADHGFTCPA